METFDKLTSANTPRPRTSSRLKAWFFRPAHIPWYRRLHLRRLALLMVGIAAAAYVSAATALWTYTRFHRGITTVAFTDVAAPFRWDRYRVKIGEHQIAEAERFMREEKYSEAFTFVRAGLARAPRHRDGRLLAARLLNALKRTDAARQTLLDGLEFHGLDAGYLPEVFAFLRRHQDDATLVATARRLLRSGEVPRRIRHILLAEAASILVARGDHSAAEEWLNSDNDFGASTAGRLLRARISWGRGLHQLALVELRVLAAANPQEFPIHMELVRWLRALGQTAEARRAILTMQIAMPDRPEPKVEMLAAYHAEGDFHRMSGEAEKILRTFPKDEAVMRAIADLAATLGSPQIARSVEAHARSYQYDSKPYQLLVVEALVESKDYHAARSSCQELLVQIGDDAEYRHLAVALHSLLAIACHGMGDTTTSNSHVDSLLLHPNISPALLTLTGGKLKAAGALAPARRLLAKAVERDAKNPAALTSLLEIDLATKRFEDVASAISRLLAIRQPPPDLIRALQYELSGDRYIFSTDARLALELLLTHGSK